LATNRTKIDWAYKQAEKFLNNYDGLRSNCPEDIRAFAALLRRAERRGGYSCTQAADHMLGVIRHTFGSKDSSNVLILSGERYFYERGRENADGAITGTLMLMLPNDYARNAGSYKIAADGTIVRFPKLTAVQRKECENIFRDLSARNPQLLSAWSHGAL
jgi:hypothetical protein